MIAMDKKYIVMTLEHYHHYYPRFYAFWYVILTSFSIFCNCFLYLYNYVTAQTFAITEVWLVCHPHPIGLFKLVLYSLYGI